MSRSDPHDPLLSLSAGAGIVKEQTKDLSRSGQPQLRAGEADPRGVLRCDHDVPLTRTCLCCGGSADWLALVAAGVYDAEGFTPKERKAQQRKAKR